MLMVKCTIFTMLVVTAYWAKAEAQTWAKTVVSGKEKTTTLQFYFHDILSGNTPTAVQVAQPTKSIPSQTKFGIVMMADDPLTVGPKPDSKLVGRAQGLYGSASQGELGLIMALSYNFIDGQYKDSSISIMGRNTAMRPIREMPVVGGTGFFRMARGYAVAQTYWFDMKTGDAIVGYNVTIHH